ERGLCRCYSSLILLLGFAMLYPHPLKTLGVLDACQIPLLYPFNSQRRNERSAHSTPILRTAQHYRIALPLWPVQNFPQCLRAPLLEVRILVEDGAIGAHVARLNAFLLADGGDAAGRKASGTC